MAPRKPLRTLSVAVAAMILALVIPASGADRGKLIHVFGQYGNSPHGGLTFDSAGNLYGTVSDPFQCSFGPPCGGVFKLTPTPGGKWRTSLVHRFTAGQGAFPTAGVIFDEAGNLYGTTVSGGDQSCGEHESGCGVVFKLTPTRAGKWTETVLHSFTGGTDGAYPHSNLIFDSAGNLYGTASEGGDLLCGSLQGCGVVFELSPNGSGDAWTETVLHTFTGANGSCPVASLVLDQSGNLYGTAANSDTRGCGYTGLGVVFELARGSGNNWKESVVHAFTGADGAGPVAGLILDSAGNLYGTTAYGGNCCGVVFELSPTFGGEWKETVLHSFNGADGSYPAGNLTLDTAGNLYGTTFYGGGSPNCDFGGCGVVFELVPSPGGWEERALRFTGNDGAWPAAGVTLDSAGSLYGTTILGGAHDGGAVFEVYAPNLREIEKPQH